MHVQLYRENITYFNKPNTGRVDIFVNLLIITKKGKNERFVLIVLKLYPLFVSLTL